MVEISVLVQSRGRGRSRIYASSAADIMSADKSAAKNVEADT